MKVKAYSLMLTLVPSSSFQFCQMLLGSASVEAISFSAVRT